MVLSPFVHMYNVYLLQCLGAKHAGCRSATVQAFVFIQHVAINMVWISGVARYWLPIRILLPYLWLHFRHHCLWWDKFGFLERTLCFIAVIKSRNAFSRTVRWKMSIPLKTSIIIIIDGSDSWFYNVFALRSLEADILSFLVILKELQQGLWLLLRWRYLLK